MNVDSKDFGSKKDQTKKGGSKGTNQNKNATDAHSLYSLNPANSEPEFEIGGFDTIFSMWMLVEVRESEWLQIGVETGAGKTAWAQGAPHTGSGFLVMWNSLSGRPLESLSRLHVEGCDDWGVNLRVRSVQALVCKPLLSVGECTTMGGVTVLHGDKGYMFHKCSNVAKKVEAWIQKDIRSSQDTVARVRTEKTTCTTST